jgi:hypothetical protein
MLQPLADQMGKKLPGLKDSLDNSGEKKMF